jgi:TolB-like protein
MSRYFLFMREYSFSGLKFLLCMAISLSVLCYAERKAEGVVEVAILPLRINADKDIEYINRGIRDMITSRISQGTYIRVIEQDLLKDFHSKVLLDKLTKKEIQEMGSTLGVDYVVFGSITKIEDNASIDMNVLNVLQGDITKSVFAQSEGLDKLIPEMNKLAQEIKDAISTGFRSLPPETFSTHLPEAEKKLLEDELKVNEGVLDRIKEEIKQEILAELQEEKIVKAPLQTHNPTDQEQLKEELTQEIMVKLREQDGSYGSSRSSKSLGSAEGRILRNSEAFSGCRVKLVRMTRYGILTKIFQDYNLDIEFETITDKEGKYHFNNLPTGSYKLKWELPGDEGWVRRLQNKPDVTIENGKKSLLTDVETNRKLVPR